MYYDYVKSNPVSNADPLGLWTVNIGISGSINIPVIGQVGIGGGGFGGIVYDGTRIQTAKTSMGKCICRWRRGNSYSWHCWRDVHVHKDLVRYAMWKITKIVSAVLAVGFWFSSFFVWTYYNSHKPKAYMPDEGRIFPLDTHGSVVYLTAGEHYLLYGLVMAGIGFALLAAFSYFMSWRD